MKLLVDMIGNVGRADMNSVLNPFFSEKGSWLPAKEREILFLQFRIFIYLPFVNIRHGQKRVYVTIQNLFEKVYAGKERSNF